MILCLPLYAIRFDRDGGIVKETGVLNGRHGRVGLPGIGVLSNAGHRFRRRYPACDLALSPVHTELRGR